MVMSTHFSCAFVLLLMLHNYVFSNSVTIQSKKQIVSDKEYTFFDSVSLNVLNKYHILADSVVYNASNKFFSSKAQNRFGVKIETEDYLIYAKQFNYDVNVKKIIFHDVTMSLNKGYIVADVAEQLSDNEWVLFNALYTPCDADCPHWRITTQEALLSKNNIQTKSTLLSINRCPIVYTPHLLVPIQGKPQSGLLIPKLSYYARTGIGFMQEYYWYLNPHADSTIGIDWKHNRGLFCTYNSRWVGSLDDYWFTKGYFGRAWNTFIQRDEKIMRTSRNRYWIKSEGFNHIGRIGNSDIRLLGRIDYGTDKRIGYQFLDTLADVDDTFSNNGVMRWYNDSQLLDLRIDAIQSKRNRFSALNNNDILLIKNFLSLSDNEEKDLDLFNKMQKKVLENSFVVFHLPYVEYSNRYNKVFDFFSYRHDVMADYVSFREYEFEKMYVLNTVACEDTLIPKFGDELLRFDYRGVARKHFYFLNHSFALQIAPCYQMRSKVADYRLIKKTMVQRRFSVTGAQRFFCELSTECALPELTQESYVGNYIHYMQPVFMWNYLPVLYEKNYYIVDKWDVVYPKNEVTATVRNNLLLGDVRLDWYVSCGLDLYKRKKRFPLRRAMKNNTLLPLKNCIIYENDVSMLSWEFEYDCVANSLLSSESTIRSTLGYIDYSISHLYMNSHIQKRRELLSNITNFAYVELGMPLNNHATLEYSGHFSVEPDSYMYKPLVHQIKFKYSGHCWGFYLGFEEKVYRESGIPRREQLAIFSLYFDSLGSIGKKIKSPYSS